MQDEKSFRHNLVMENREKLSVTGVLNVISFDEDMIVAETEMGILVIKGEYLNMNSLSLEKGEIDIDGTVYSINYEEKAMRKDILSSEEFLNNNIMILSINNQLFLFLLSVFFGFVIGFFYDFLIIFRKIIKHFKFMVQIEDLIYWTISALLLFFIMLKENHGEIRGFLILGSFIGMILYFSAVSKIFLKISDKILSLIKKILIVTFKILFTPIGYVLKLFKKIFDLTIGNIIFNKIKFNKLKFKKKTRK